MKQSITAADPSRHSFADLLPSADYERLPDNCGFSRLVHEPHRKTEEKFLASSEPIDPGFLIQSQLFGSCDGFVMAVLTAAGVAIGAGGTLVIVALVG